MSVPRILVIEDNPADVLILRFALDQQNEPYDLDVLCDGEEALQFVHEHRTGKRPADPCVIVLDLHLPRHSGLQVLRAVMESPPLAHIKVIMLTGIASPDEQFRITQLGALYRPKPTALEQYADLAAEIFILCRAASVAAA